MRQSTLLWKAFHNRQIRDGPLFSFRPARPHQIAQQMQMKTDANQRGGLPTRSCQTEGYPGHQGTKAQIMAKQMVVLGPPRQRM